MRREAESQLELLAATSGPSYQSDFYSYRYFASEGFLPGYNFPRLPLSAFIPGRSARRVTRDEFVSAPPVPGDHRVRAAEHRLPRGRALRRQPGDPAGPAAGRGGGPADRAREAVRRLWLPARDRPTGGGPDLCERCGAASAPLTDAASAAERRDQAPRPDLLRRGGAPAPGLRGPHRRPVRRGRRRPWHSARAKQRCGASPARDARLRPRGHDLADQPRLDAAEPTASSSASCSTPSAATGPATTRSRPTTPTTR